MQELNDNDDSFKTDESNIAPIVEEVEVDMASMSPWEKQLHFVMETRMRGLISEALAPLTKELRKVNKDISKQQDEVSSLNDALKA